MKSSHPARIRGFTLVELMGAVVISMVVIVLLYKIFATVQSVFTVSQNRARTMESGRVAMDMMVKDFQALAPAALNDTTGEVPNLEWFELGEIDFISPVRRYYISAINYDTGEMEVENLMAPTVGDRIYFPDSQGALGAYGGYGTVINSAQKQFAYLREMDGGNPLIRYNNQTGISEPPDELKRVEIHMINISAFSHSRWQLYDAMSQGLYWHGCSFFTNDEGWRYVKYKFGGRENYKTINLASPVGALWVYRSRVVPRSGLRAEREDHAALIAHDPAGRRLEDPVGFSRVMDGVIHFRVRAVSPLDPAKALASPASSFYTGGLVPSHVVIELAVADRNLVLKMEQTIEQQMEEVTDLRLKNRAKLKYLSQNLDRIYYYKQLIRIKERGE